MENLEDLTVKELSDLAKEAEIEGRSKMDKDELVAALSEVEAAPVEEEAQVEEEAKKPGPTYRELFTARTEMDNAYDELQYWKRALVAARSLNTLTHREARVAEVQNELSAASERYSNAYKEFHTLRGVA